MFIHTFYTQNKQLLMFKGVETCGVATSGVVIVQASGDKTVVKPDLLTPV